MINRSSRCPLRKRYVQDEPMFCRKVANCCGLSQSPLSRSLQRLLLPLPRPRKWRLCGDRPPLSQSFDDQMILSGGRNVRFIHLLPKISRTPTRRRRHGRPRCPRTRPLRTSSSSARRCLRISIASITTILHIHFTSQSVSSAYSTAFLSRISPNIDRLAKA